MSGAARLTAPFAPGTALGDEVPAGFRALRRRTVVGTDAAFRSAGEAVLAWAVQRRSGIEVLGADGRAAPPAEEGLEGAVVVPLPAGPRVVAPMRVTRVLHERDRIGLLYGTLPGHPEVGEEAFLVHRIGPETVLEIRALSRPAFPYSLAAPVGLALQRRFTERYLRALTA